jgi:hypothetical protein
LKKNIRPLYEALLEEHVRVLATSPKISGIDRQAAIDAARSRPNEWQKNVTETGITKLDPTSEPLASKLFRQLRPIAYHLKSDVESKRMSFGFIAQELQELYPNLVVENFMPTADGQKSQLAVSY